MAHVASLRTLQGGRRQTQTPAGQSVAEKGRWTKDVKLAVVFVVIVLVAILGLIAFSWQSATVTNCTSTWECGTVYPLQSGGQQGVASQACFANSTYFFCIGGLDAGRTPEGAVYSATLSSANNVTGWVLDSQSYPVPIAGQSCVVSSGYVYCVGGYSDVSGDDTASAYYSQIMNGSLGRWLPTTPYPVPVDSQSCVAWSSTIYCVAGNNETSGTGASIAPSSAVWFAHLSTAGIGSWAETTAYPQNAYLPSCSEWGGYIYCVGGVDVGSNPDETVYFAPLSYSGVGLWSPGTVYPLSAVGQACAAANGFIYCVGGVTGGESEGGQLLTYTGSVFYAPVSPKGIGNWTQGPDFPQLVATTCASYGGYLYCIGGYNGSTLGFSAEVNYATLASIVG